MSRVIDIEKLRIWVKNWKLSYDGYYDAVEELWGIEEDTAGPGELAGSVSFLLESRNKIVACEGILFDTVFFTVETKEANDNS